LIHFDLTMCLTSNDDAERQHQTDGERRDTLLRSSEPDLPGMLKDCRISIWISS
jgi:hypothetical protein